MKKRFLFCLLLLSGNISAQVQVGVSGAWVRSVIGPNRDGPFKRFSTYQAAFNVRLLSGAQFSYRSGIGFSYLKAGTGNFNPYVNYTYSNTVYEYRDVMIPLEIRYDYGRKRGRIYNAVALIPTLNLGRKVTHTFLSPGQVSPAFSITEGRLKPKMDLLMSGTLGFGWASAQGISGYLGITFQTNVFALAYREIRNSGNYTLVRVLGIEAGMYIPTKNEKK
jgi:hypothetical protein